MPVVNATEVYSREFFARHADRSARSAGVVVPLVLSLFPVRSVVDVGCGVGPWAAEFLSQGVEDVWGIDGEYVDLSRLRIPPGRFLARDLTQLLQLDRTFDLAVCLEVAEHLPKSRASGLVADLTSLAPCVLFSAAVPGQGGVHHLNEQYLSYWIDLFQGRGYQGIDAVRPWVLGNKSVQWFYQQNIVVFAAPEHPLMASDLPKAQDIVHQNLYERVRTGQGLGLRTLLGALPGALLSSMRYHLGGRGGLPPKD